MRPLSLLASALLALFWWQTGVKMDTLVCGYAPFHTTKCCTATPFYQNCQLVLFWQPDSSSGQAEEDGGSDGCSK